MKPRDFFANGQHKPDTVRKAFARRFNCPYSSDMELSEEQEQFLSERFASGLKSGLKSAPKRPRARTLPRTDTVGASVNIGDFVSSAQSVSGAILQPDKDGQSMPKSAWQNYLPTTANLLEMASVLYGLSVLGGQMLFIVGLMFCCLLGYLQFLAGNADNARSGQTALWLAALMNIFACVLIEYPAVRQAFLQEGLELPYDVDYYAWFFSIFVSGMSFSAVLSRWNKAQDDSDAKLNSTTI